MPNNNRIFSALTLSTKSIALVPALTGNPHPQPPVSIATAAELYMLASRRAQESLQQRRWNNLLAIILGDAS